MELIFGLDDIDDAARSFLELSAGRSVLAFRGEMGAGKTSFIRALCNAMGIKEGFSSPTFSIINEYLTSNDLPVYHMDLYRLNNEIEAIQAGVEDYLYSGATCLVEWPEKLPALFPDDTLYCDISVVGTNARKLQINL